MMLSSGNSCESGRAHSQMKYIVYSTFFELWRHSCVYTLIANSSKPITTQGLHCLLYNNVIHQMLFAITFLCFAGSGFKCNYCLTTKGWDDCVNNMKEITCPSDHQCGKAHVESKGENLSLAVYFKGCAKPAECNKNSCKAFLQNHETEEISKCEVNCCNGHLCNKAQITMTSVIMLLTCALLASVFL